MNSDPAAEFLNDLPVFTAFEDVADAARYRPLPDGWALAMADIVSSGKAIAAGKYKSVNMAGAAVISAMLNALGQTDYPFVFGGDGAVVAVPPHGLEAARRALAAVGRWISEELQLEMRTALVPIGDIRAAGLDVQVALFEASEFTSFAMLAGGGTAWADAKMKQGQFAVAMAPPGTQPDLTGLSCRWDPVRSSRGQIVSFIAVPGADGPTAAFRSLVGDLVALADLGENASRPLPLEGPRPRLYFGGVDAEARAQAPAGKRLRARFAAVVAICLTVILHRLKLTLGGFDARRYTRDVAANSDFRKFDDGLKMTIDIDDAALSRLTQRLDRAVEEGVCQYGLHKQDEALITCIVVTPLSRNHMHFVDGAAGGYALAAERLKAKISRGGERGAAAAG